MVTPTSVSKTKASRPRATCLALVSACVALAPLSANAQLSAQDTCTLSAPLEVKLRNSVQGTVETELAVGSELTIVDPGLHVTGVRAGELDALASTEALEAACTVAKERCVLESALKMATVGAGGKQRAFRVKEGATLSVLERNASRARVLVGGVLGRVNTAHLDERCRPLERERPSDTRASGKQPPVGPAPEGVQVAFLPFAIAPGASAVDARAFEDAVSAALRGKRKDVLGPREPRPNENERRLDPKVHLHEAAALGARMGVRYVVTGHLSQEGDTRVLSLSVYDVGRGRLVRTVRARPTLHEKDPWARLTSERVNEVLPGAS